MRPLLLAGAMLLAWITHAHADSPPIRVCARADGTMRFLPNPEGFPQLPVLPCKDGERELKLSEWQPEIEKGPGEDPDVTALRGRVETLERRIGKLDSELGETRKIAQTERNQLHDRIRLLEAQLADKGGGDKGSGKAAARVSAPFEVLGKDGKVILRVADSVPRASGDRARVTIASSTTSGFGLRIYNASDQLVGGLVEAGNGGAIVAVMDASGELAANMSGSGRSVSVFGPAGDALAGLVAESRGGTLAVYNSGRPVAYLTQASSGAGGNVTTLLNNGGQAFSAGALPNGGGEACVNRMTPQGARGACLGLALPGGLSQ